MMLRTSVDNATPSGYDSWITYLGSESWSAAITTSSGENSPSVVESDGPASDAVALEPTVLGRRRALQAALGGAAAGAAFVAPRIQGMSVVPTVTVCSESETVERQASILGPILQARCQF